MQVIRIDHVHLEVADRETAADWYHHVLGLTRYEGFESWADDPMGPLILAGGDGYPALSLFAREFKNVSRDATIAFRVSGEDFLKFRDRVDGLELLNKSGNPVTRQDVEDHTLSWSIYFCDLNQNWLEITTYDYELVADAL